MLGKLVTTENDRKVYGNLEWRFEKFPLWHFCCRKYWRVQFKK